MSFTVNVIAGSYANRVLHYCLHLQHGNYNSLNNVLGSEYCNGHNILQAMDELAWNHYFPPA